MINLPVSIMLMKLFAEQGSLDNQIILVLVLERFTDKENTFGLFKSTIF